MTAIVASALRSGGIRAVVSGGACASLHSGGLYQSEDIDLIVTSAISQARLDETLREVGFRRDRDRFVHPDTRFFVEGFAEAFEEFLAAVARPEQPRGLRGGRRRT